jgi:hypothetical protein
MQPKYWVDHARNSSEWTVKHGTRCVRSWLHPAPAYAAAEQFNAEQDRLAQQEQDEAALVLSAPDRFDTK